MDISLPGAAEEATTGFVLQLVLNILQLVKVAVVLNAGGGVSPTDGAVVLVLPSGSVWTGRGSLPSVHLANRHVKCIHIVYYCVKKKNIQKMLKSPNSTILLKSNMVQLLECSSVKSEFLMK